MFSSIKGKLMAILVLVTALILMSVTWLNYSRAASILESEIKSAATNGARHNAETVNNWLAGIRNEVATLARVPAIESMDWDSQLSLLGDTASRRHEYETFIVADKEGLARATSGSEDLYDISDRSYFKRVIQTGSVTISDPILSKMSNELVIAIAAPIYGEEGSRVGALAATVTLDYLQKLVKDMNIGGSGYGYIINNNKTVIAHPESKWVNNKEMWDLSDSLAEMAGAMTRGEEGYGNYIFQGEEMETAFAPVTITGWTIAQSANTSDVMAPLAQIKRQSLLLAFAALAIMLIIAFVIANSVAKPLTNLSRKAEAVAKGDLTQGMETIWAKNSKDEMGVLTASFAQMIENLQFMIVQVRGISDRLASHSQELASSSEEVSATVEEVASTTGEVVSVSDQGAANAKNAAEESEQVQNVAREGNKAVQETVEKINSIANVSETVAVAVKKLGEQSNQIGEIINTITNLSEQTNLLALNAAIEAARAGEHGKGFAVVAEEVRKLAEQSAASAGEITGLIEEIQVGVEEAVTAMDKGVLEVNEGVQIAGNAGAALEQIIKAVEQNTNKIKEVAAGINQANEGTQELSASNEQITVTIQQVSGAAQELAQITADLQGAVAKFDIAESRQSETMGKEEIAEEENTNEEVADEEAANEKMVNEETISEESAEERIIPSQETDYQVKADEEWEEGRENYDPHSGKSRRTDFERNS